MVWIISGRTCLVIAVHAAPIRPWGCRRGSVDRERTIQFNTVSGWSVATIDDGSDSDGGGGGGGGGGGWPWHRWPNSNRSWWTDSLYKNRRRCAAWDGACRAVTRVRVRTKVRVIDADDRASPTVAVRRGRRMVRSVACVAVVAVVALVVRGIAIRRHRPGPRR